MDQHVTDPNESERKWIVGNVALAGEIATAVGISVEPGDPLDPATLDTAWAAGMAGHARGEEDPNPYINAFGIALGQHLVDWLGLEWKLVEEKGSHELAVWGQEGDILVFPPNLVGKRYVSGITTFFADVASQTEQRVGKIRAQAAEPGGEKKGLGRFFGRR